MPHLSGDPLRVFAGGQPQRGRRMAGLIRTPRFESEKAEQGIPDPFGDIVVIQVLAVSGAENVR